MRAMFNGETLVNEVAFDVGRGLQGYSQCTDRANEATPDHYILRNYTPLELRVLSEHKRDATDVPLNLAVEMELALGCHIAGNR